MVLTVPPPMRPIGTTGMKTSPIMLGGNVFGWTTDRAGGFDVLDAFVGGGGVLLDTADMYTNWIPGMVGGESETLIGEWQSKRGVRDKVLIATKVGRGEGAVAGLSRSAIETGVDQSLRRLQTDYIDIYFAHLDDEATPLDETLAAFDNLLRAGKVRAIGASHYSADRLAEAKAICTANGFAQYQVLQPLYSLMMRDGYEGAVQRFCVENNIAVTPFYVLASGFLTGKYRKPEDIAGTKRAHELEGYLTPKGWAVLAAMDEVAAQTGATVAQVAMAWAMAQPGVVAPIGSATSRAQVNELIGAMQVSLTPAHLDLLDRASRLMPAANA